MRAERGVYLPLVGVFTLLCMFYMIALGIDTGIAKRVRLDAQERVDRDCRGVAEELPITKRAVDQFAKSFRISFDNPDDISKKATFSFDHIPQDTMRLILPTAGASAYMPHLFNGILPLSWPDEWFGRWKYYEDVEHPDFDNVNVHPNYPAGFWSHPNSFGSVVGCEMQLSANTIKSGSSIVNVKSAYRRLPISGDQDDGFLIGIAPYHFTLRSASRFKFTDSALKASNLLTVAAPHTPFGSQSSVAGTDQKLSSLSGNNLEEQLIACHNPVSYLRNRIVSSLVGFLARSSFGRERTEIRLISPRDVKLNITGKLEPIAIVPEVDSIHPHMTTSGDDIAVASNLHMPPRVSLALDGTALDINTSTHLPLIEQIRSCYHLYSANPAFGLSATPDSSFDNSGYEDSSITPSAQLTALYDTTPPIKPTWGPYQYEELTGRYFESVSLRAEELMRIIPSVQANPSGITTDMVTTKESAGDPQKLVGNLLGFLEQARKDNIAALNVLLVTHLPLTAPERDAIADEIRDHPDYWQERYITVLYFPTNKSDAKESQYINMQKAFMPPENNSTPYQGENRVLIFRYKDSKDHELRLLWNTMIADGDASKNIESASEVARNIWTQRLTKLVLGL